MANTDNKTNHLDVDNKVYPAIDLLFQTQESLQDYIAEKKGLPQPLDISTSNIRNIGEWMLKQKHAFDDEFSEMMDALGGIDDGIGSAAWKWWKDDNKKANLIYLSDLSDNDLKELKMEYVDMLHFFINMGLFLGMDGSEVMNMYISKNKENIERQKNNY